MNTPHAYNTLSEAVNDLRSRGYVKDYNLKEDRLVCEQNLVLYPADFEIVEMYRFEGESDPADEAVVYGIQSRRGEKGVMVNGYGIYSEAIADEMLRKLTIHR